MSSAKSPIAGTALVVHEDASAQSWHISVEYASATLPQLCRALVSTVGKKVGKVVGALLGNIDGIPLGSALGGLDGSAEGSVGKEVSVGAGVG